MANFKTSSGYWRTLLLGFVAPILLWGGAVWAATVYGNTPIAPEVVAETLPQAGQQQDFVSAWARLDHALAHHGYQSAQTVLKRVRDQNAARGASVCNFEWKQGQVSLVYGQNPAQPMGRDMSNCADAVEREESSQ